MRTPIVAALICVALATPAAAEPLIALTTTNRLITFDSATPGTASAPIQIVGMQGGATEVIQGIDVRPRTGGLYALGIVPGATDTLRLYLLNPTTGAATQVGQAVTGIALQGTFYGIDFNPTADRLRVVNTNDENLRLNPNNGSLSGDDTNLNAAGRLIDGVAYDRNFEGRLGAGTTLFGIARVGAALVRIGGVDQDPSPNGGAVTNIGGLGVTPSAAAGIGFDISGATGIAYAVMTLGPSTSLFTISLTTGAATLVGAVGNGATGVRGIAVLAPARVAFGAEGKNTALVFDPLAGGPGGAFDAFPKGAAKGVRVAVGDVTRDGVPDLILGGGGRIPAAVKILDGKTGNFLTQILAYEVNAKVGVQVASGDVNGDGFDDVITAPGPGVTTEVRVYSGESLRLLGAFTPFGADYTGGATVAAADFDFDGDSEIVVASGKGLAPQIRVFNAPTFASLGVIPIPLESTKGLTVAAAVGVPGVIAVGAAAGSADVVVLKGGISGGVATFTVAAQFAAYEGSGKGVRLALVDLNADSAPELFAVPGGSNATCRIFDGATFAAIQTFTPLDNKGAFVAAGR